MDSKRLAKEIGKLPVMNKTPKTVQKSEAEIFSMNILKKMNHTGFENSPK